MHTDGINFTWKPWETYKDSNPNLSGIDEPPCKKCVHWKPQATFLKYPTGFEFDGVVCCHAVDMQHDFSCYRKR